MPVVVIVVVLCVILAAIIIKNVVPKNTELAKIAGDVVGAGTSVLGAKSPAAVAAAAGVGAPPPAALGQPIPGQPGMIMGPNGPVSALGVQSQAPSSTPGHSSNVVTYAVVGLMFAIGLVLVIIIGQKPKHAAHGK
jgi:hypothetical protein